MVKAMDFKSEGGSACRFDFRYGRFFFLLFFMMIMVERCACERKARASTCRNEPSEFRR